MTGFILAKVSPIAHVVTVWRSLRRTPGVTEMHEITGEYDLLIKVVAKDLEELRGLVNEVRRRKGIHGLETILSIREVK